MEVIAQGKFIRISPKKARPVADLVRGKNAKIAFETLKLMPQRTASEIRKVLGSAMANAENNFNLDKDALIVAKIMVDGGPVLKRHQPRGKGSASAIKKRTSHITVIVSGDIKTKRSASSAQEKVAEKAEKTTKEVKEVENKKIEVEKPEFIKEDKKVAPKSGVKNTFYRRKTG
jgi:large subunit ribosomal protein L22